MPPGPSEKLQGHLASLLAYLNVGSLEPALAAAWHGPQALPYILLLL